MSKKIVAGNWKMNKTLQEGMELAKNVVDLVKKDSNDVTVILAPPFIHLTELAKIVDNKKVFLAAQNCASEAKGAYTGEVSAEMIASTGAQYVIIGHSERRAYYNEKDDVLNKKVKLALENGLKVIFCIGEVLEEREKENHFNVVESQLQNGLFNLSPDEFKNVVVAYEPVWAIGTGVTASPEQAQEMHGFIRDKIVQKYGDDLAGDTTILYGGSCNAANAKTLFANKDVDGGLIGGAALKAEDFHTITKSY